MTKTAHLWPEARQAVGNSIIIGAAIESGRAERFRIWFKMPSSLEDRLNDRADPMLLAVLFWTMSNASRLLVHGSVSQSLLRNLEEFQSVWSRWRPNRYRVAEIVADREIEAITPAAANSSLIAFSGGVDSAFSVWRRCRNRRSEGLSGAVMVHGFDIPLNRTDVFDRAASKAKATLDSVGLELFTLSTNLREVERSSWEDCHGAAISAALSLMGRGCSSGILASGWEVRRQRGSDGNPSLTMAPWGSNPLTDPLLSSRDFRIEHDGAGFGRIEKVDALSTWPEALANLRVCWQGEFLDRNCGRCEKCVRTLLDFRVLGLGKPECFEQDARDVDILKLIRLSAGQLVYLEQVLAAAAERRISHSWVRAAQVAIRMNRLKLKAKTLLRR